MGLFKSKEEKELELTISRIQMNLENNYKDLAISYLKDSEALFHRLCEEEKLNAKKKEHYGRIIEGYQQRMKGYNHTDISKFLHDTL